MKLPVDYTLLSPRERADVRAEYIKQQDGKCYWCKETLNLPPPKHITDHKIDWRIFPDNFLKWPIHIQHNHTTGMTEGAVHAYCNAVMFQYHGR